MTTEPTCTCPEDDTDPRCPYVAEFDNPIYTTFNHLSTLEQKGRFLDQIAYMFSPTQRVPNK